MSAREPGKEIKGKGEAYLLLVCHSFWTGLPSYLWEEREHISVTTFHHAKALNYKWKVYEYILNALV